MTRKDKDFVLFKMFTRKIPGFNANEYGLWTEASNLRSISFGEEEIKQMKDFVEGRNVEMISFESIKPKYGQVAFVDSDIKAETIYRDEDAEDIIDNAAPIPKGTKLTVEGEGDQGDSIIFSFEVDGDLRYLKFPLQGPAMQKLVTPKEYNEVEKFVERLIEMGDLGVDED